MEIKDLISSRLGGESFYVNDYYKFEKYANLKKKWLEEHPNETLLDFGIGESDMMTPSFILDTLSKEIFKYENRVYADNGIDDLKIAAAKHLKEIYGIKINNPLTQINHIMGAKSALGIIPLALVDYKDIVITTTPGYQVLSNMAKWLNAKIYYAPLIEDNNFIVDLEAISEEVYKKTKIFSINYPNNPTGATATLSFYKKLVILAKKYGFLIVNDNTYGALSNKPLSIFNVKEAFDCAVEIHSFSKSFNMTGMRLGFIVGNEQIIDLFKKVKDNVDSGQYIAIQKAAISAIENEKNYLSRLNARYNERKKQVCKVLRQNNIDCKQTNATFYLYVKVPNHFSSADEFSRFLLDNCGIFTIPWDECEPHIRLSMTFKSEKDEHFYELLNERIKKITK